MANYALTASLRTDKGKGASRRLRREAGLVPAILYGGNDEPTPISLAHKDLVKALEDPAIFTQILDLKIDGKTQQAFLKDLQRHPARPVLLHADFLRIDATTQVTIRVPIVLLNEEQCKGVRQQSGMLQRNLTELEVRCLPADLPDTFEIDVAELEVGDAFMLSDLKLPQGVELTDLIADPDYDDTIVSVVEPRISAADEALDEAEADAAAEEAAESEGEGEDDGAEEE